MKNNILQYLSIIALITGLSACSDSNDMPDKSNSEGKQMIEFRFYHPDGSRATETAFDYGDLIGVSMTEADKPLEIAGNIVNNAKFRFEAGHWTTSQPLYWDKGEFNVFAHYPYIRNIYSISDYEFEVKTDQRESNLTDINGYEASDFLFASAKNVTASSEAVSLRFKHIMSKLTIRLIKGEDYDGEIPENLTVMIHNTVTKATIDLEAGVATKDMYGEPKTIMARKDSPTSYSAILVPQRLDTRVPLVEVIINGVSFLYESRFQFKPGMMHIINLVIDENPEKIKIEIGGTKTTWY